MTRHQIEEALANAVERLRAEGDSWWPGTTIAPVAYRRLTTFTRRNRSKQPSDAQRINDLAKGLRAYFEPDVPYTPLTDWEALASALVREFLEFSQDEQA